jgi:hypothetical protein
LISALQQGNKNESNRAYDDALRQHTAEESAPFAVYRLSGDELVYCTNCGEETIEGGGYCGSCGKKISKNKLENSHENVGGADKTLKVLEPQLVVHKIWGGGYLFQFPYTKRVAVAQTIASLFEREGYHLEEGNIMSGIYGVGSAGKRLLAGAFSKRYRFKFVIHEKDGLTLFEIYKAMSGFSGGVLGIRALDKEWERILAEVKSLRFV